MKREDLQGWRLFHIALMKARDNRYIDGIKFRAEMRRLRNDELTERAYCAFDEIRDEIREGERASEDMYHINGAINNARERFISGEKSFNWVICECDEIAFDYSLDEWDVLAMFCYPFCR